MSDKAWQTYADKARGHLYDADRDSPMTHGGVERQQAQALMGIGYALLALVELHQPVELEVLEVKQSVPNLLGFHVIAGACNDMERHTGHHWRGMAGDDNTVMWCPGVPS